jgi:hypothetical protein
MPSIEKKAKADPTKAFFVRMITRDIGLADCILDLIDNSIDGAWRQEGSRPMGLTDRTDLSKYEILINISEDGFKISDNCGGMTLDDAVNHAFSFGRNEKQDHSEFSIGVYGIGMKRAVFKIGKDIRIRSTYRDGLGRSQFVVPIKVASWLNDQSPPWDFDIDSDEPLAADGVEIAIADLTAETKNAFENPAFLISLRRTIARDYSHHLSRGLRISLNNRPIVGWKIELLQSEDFQPVQFSYQDEIGGDQVSVQILGGMAAPPPDSSDPEENDAEGDRRFGWYVVCNGRVVLAGDKSAVSGWGTVDWPQWHRQYDGFIGIVLFNASNALALPLTTTKRSVDTSSPVFLRARPRMRDLTKAWIEYTNRRKHVLESAKSIEQIAKPISIYSLPQRTVVVLPKFETTPIQKRGNISYSMPVEKLDELRDALGNVNMTNREVGIRSFEFTYKNMVGDE